VVRGFSVLEVGLTIKLSVTLSGANQPILSLVNPTS